MIKKYGIIFLTSIFSFIIYSCGGEEGSGANTILGSTTNEPTLSIEHAEELTFKLNAYNFPDAKYFSFYIDYDMSKLTYSSYTSGIGNPVIFITDSTGVQFAFMPNKSLASDNGNAVEVLGLTFTGGNYKDTKILIKDFYALDQNNTHLDSLNISGICYLDTGIKIQAEENTREPMEDWKPTGEYIWNSQWCGYID